MARRRTERPSSFELTFFVLFRCAHLHRQREDTASRSRDMASSPMDNPSVRASFFLSFFHLFLFSSSLTCMAEAYGQPQGYGSRKNALCHGTSKTRTEMCSCPFSDRGRISSATARRLSAGRLSSAAGRPGRLSSTGRICATLISLAFSCQMFG